MMNKILSILLLLSICFTGTAFASEQVLFYHTDPAGTPLAMTDSSGNVVWKADYKPFGEENSTSGSASNDRRFVGKEKDDETGLSYFGARYEDAKIGRFIAPDPVRAVDPHTSKTNEKILLDPLRLNAYAYALNNPYAFVDQDGKWAELLLIPILYVMLSPSHANAPDRNTPTVNSQTTGEFIAGVASMEVGGRLAGDLIGLIGRESAPIARSLGAAAVGDEKVLQTGGHTLLKSTLKELGLSKEQGKQAMEALKKDILAPANFHETKILSNGDVFHTQSGKLLGNLRDYVP
jgi:RHS repeat-associated protein